MHDASSLHSACRHRRRACRRRVGAKGGASGCEKRAEIVALMILFAGLPRHQRPPPNQRPLQRGQMQRDELAIFVVNACFGDPPFFPSGSRRLSRTGPIICPWLVPPLMVFCMLHFREFRQLRLLESFLSSSWQPRDGPEQHLGHVRFASGTLSRQQVANERGGPGRLRRPSKGLMAGSACSCGRRLRRRLSPPTLALRPAHRSIDRPPPTRC